MDRVQATFPWGWFRSDFISNTHPDQLLWLCVCLDCLLHDTPGNWFCTPTSPFNTIGCDSLSLHTFISRVYSDTFLARSKVVLHCYFGYLVPPDLPRTDPGHGLFPLHQKQPHLVRRPRHVPESSLRERFSRTVSLTQQASPQVLQRHAGNNRWTAISSSHNLHLLHNVP